MAKMTDDQLLSLVRASDQYAVEYSSQYNRESEEYLKAYNAMEFSEELEGSSSLVSTDVMDVIEADMPSVVRTFLGSSDIMKFEPLSEREEDKKEADLKTKYSNWLIRKQPTSYAKLQSWFKDALIQNVSVMKYWVEDTLKTKEETHENLNYIEVVQLEESLLADRKAKRVDIVSSLDNEDGTFDVTFKITTGDQKFVMSKIPSENFRVSRYVGEDIEDAELVGDDEIITRGALLSQGYSKDIINQISRIGEEYTVNKRSNLKRIRFYNENFNADDNDGHGISDWASEEVIVKNRYVQIDYDGDGIAERRYIRTDGSGSVLLDNEPFDHIPYATLSAIMMPDKLIGKSRASTVMQTQEAKTAMLRGMANNIYAVNNPRMGANDKVNLDDLLTYDLDGVGVIRTAGDGNPGQHLFPVEIPFVADKTQLVMNYLDQQRANRTGALATSQSLSADDLNQETATRFTGVEKSGKEKIELIARNFAETGLRKLYEGAIWMSQRYQNTDLEILVAGQELKFNPSTWKYEHHAFAEVGLAISDNEENTQALVAVNNGQQQLIAQGSPLVDQQKLYNTNSRLIKALGLGDPMDFFNNPEKPEQLTLAQNEALMQQVQVLTQALQQSQNPLAEAEIIKARKDLIEAEQDAKLSVAKLLEDQRQFNEKLAQEQQENNRKFALQITELEQTFRTELNQQLKDNGRL